MKVTVDRKGVVTVLKALKSLSARAPSNYEQFKDVVVLVAAQDKLTLSAGFGLAFMCVSVSAEVQEQGMCSFSYKLLELLKAAKDETLIMQYNKALSLAGDSGFKAKLNEKIGASLPVDAVLNIVSQGGAQTIELYTEELENLMDISNAFTPLGEWKYLEITNNEAGINATVQGSEYGTLDQFPMQGDGDMMFLRLHPDYLRPLLSFCGERVTLRQLNASHGFIMITDADNPDWWATTVQVGKKHNEAYEQPSS